MPAEDFLSAAQTGRVRRKKRRGARAYGGGAFGGTQFGYGFYAGGPGWWGEDTSGEDDEGDGGGDGGDGGE